MISVWRFAKIEGKRALIMVVVSRGKEAVMRESIVFKRCYVNGRLKRKKVISSQ